MGNMISISAIVTMTSIELVDFINSQRGEDEAALRHRDFTAKVPKVLGAEISEKFRISLKDAYGRGQPGYRFPKREACLMAMSYSYDIQAKVFDRMTELEEKQFNPMVALNDPVILRGLLGNFTEQVSKLEHKVTELTPKADALDRISDAEGLMNITVAAKNLQVPPKKLFDYLRSQRWIYRRPGGSGNLAYQDKIQCGYLTHKVTRVEREDGTEKIVEQVMVTAKGLAKLAQVFSTNIH